MSDDAEITALLERLVADEPPFRTGLGPALDAAARGGRRRRRRATLVRGLVLSVPAVAVVAVLALTRLGPAHDAVGPATQTRTAEPSTRDVVRRIAAPAGGTPAELNGQFLLVDTGHGRLTVSAGLDGLPGVARTDALCRASARGSAKAAATGRVCSRVYLLPRQGLWLWDWVDQRPGVGPERRIGQEVIAVADLPDGHILAINLVSGRARTVFGPGGITPATIRDTLAGYTG